MRAHRYGSPNTARPAATAAARSAAMLRNTTPRRPVASTEYSRTFVSRNVPAHGTGGPPANAVPTRRNGTSPT